MYKEKQDYQVWIMIICLAIVAYFAITSIQGCSSAPVDNKTGVPVKTIMPTPVITSVPIVASPSPIAVVYPKLSWEANHPERISWSSILYREILEKFLSLDKVKDMNKYCPKYSLLTKEQRVNVWGEFFVALAYYESAWKPTESSVDVGEDDDTETYSDGLFQVSGADWESYGLQKVLPHYRHKDLLTVEPNIKLAMALMARQIERQKLICVSNEVYWATLSGKFYAPYAVHDEIAARVQKLSFCK